MIYQNKGIITDPSSSVSVGQRYAVLNVMDYGAVGNGIADDTTVIQNTVNLVQALGGGAVFLPTGKYKITSLSLPVGVSLVGNYTFDPNKSGTWLYCTDTVNPAVKMNGYTSLEAVAFFYPNQTWDSVNNKPSIAYPATIQIQSDSNHMTVRDVFMLNAYDAVDATAHHEVLVIENLRGYAIHNGVSIDDMTDSDRLKSIHFNKNVLNYAGDANANNYGGWTRANGTAFLIRGTDWLNLIDCFAYGYLNGTDLEAGITDNTKVPAGVRFIGCGFDACGTAVLANSGWGIQLDDCFFTQLNTFTAGANNGGAAVVVGSSVTDITLNGCRFWGVDQHCINSQAQKTQITGCSFNTYGQRASVDNADYRAVIIASGIGIFQGNILDAGSANRVFGVLLQNGNGNKDLSVVSANTFVNFTSNCIDVASGSDNFVVTGNVHGNCTATRLAINGSTNYVDANNVSI